MAQDPGKDRAAIKSDIALSRERMGTELNALRYELDLPRKLKDSFRHHLVIWIGTSAVAGILIAVAPARTRKVYVRPKSRKNGDGKGLIVTGTAVGVLKLAGTLLRPVIVKFVTNKMGVYAGGRAAEGNACSACRRWRTQALGPETAAR